MNDEIYLPQPQGYAPVVCVHLRELRCSLILEVHQKDVGSALYKLLGRLGRSHVASDHERCHVVRVSRIHLQVMSKGLGYCARLGSDGSADPSLEPMQSVCGTGPGAYFTIPHTDIRHHQTIACLSPHLDKPRARLCPIVSRSHVQQCHIHPAVQVLRTGGYGRAVTNGRLRTAAATIGR